MRRIRAGVRHPMVLRLGWLGRVAGARGGGELRRLRTVREMSLVTAAPGTA